MGEESMRVNSSKLYTFKIYLNNKRRPLILEGLTEEEVNDFNSNATTKMFIKYGPLIIRSEAIEYIIVK